MKKQQETGIKVLSKSKFVGLQDKLTDQPTPAKLDHDWDNRPQSSSLLLYDAI
jgi:hypothetical protein